MDHSLRLALLEGTCAFSLPDGFADLPAGERRARYEELAAEPVPEDVDEARWEEDAPLAAALPEGEDGVIRSLEGLEEFPDLRVLHLVRSEVADLRPLLALPALQLVRLGVPEGTDLSPLLSCGALRRVCVDDASRTGVTAPGSPGRRVLESLAERGVQVDTLLPDPAVAAAPFADPILRLAVLDALYERNALELPRTEFFTEYAFDDGNLARLMAVDLPQELLDGIERLVWTGGGHHLAHRVWNQWDGESDEFDVRTLTGIEALRNLRTLRLHPLDTLPAGQVAALRARGVRVESAY